MMEATRELALAKIKQLFPHTDPATVLSMLDLYGAEPHEREQNRVHLAILKLSEGDIDKLLDAVELAKTDYRDVLAAAEYPNYSRVSSTEVQKMNATERQELTSNDLHQYQSWLESSPAQGNQRAT